jgi:hypothetical protein
MNLRNILRRAHNKALNRTAIPLRFIAAGDLRRSGEFRHGG